MKPEQYWINRGADVIGTDVLRDGAAARQAKTYEWIVRLIIEKNVMDVLDVGCNVAALAYYLDQAGYIGFYSGIDSNPHALRFGQQHVKRYDERYVVFDAPQNLRSLPIESRWYEAVVVKDVIEHLEGPELLAEAFRVAAKYVIVATYIPWTNEPAEIVRHADGYYTNRYNLNDVLALTRQWGFMANENIQVKEANGTGNQIVMFQRER